MTNSSDNRLIAKAYERMLLSEAVSKSSDIPGEKTLDGVSDEKELERIRRMLIENVAWSVCRELYNLIHDRRTGHGSVSSNGRLERMFPVGRGDFKTYGQLKIAPESLDRIITGFKLDEIEPMKLYDNAGGLKDSLRDAVVGRLYDTASAKLVCDDYLDMKWVEMKPFSIYVNRLHSADVGDIEITPSMEIWMREGAAMYIQYDDDDPQAKGYYTPLAHRHHRLWNFRNLGRQYHTPNLPK